jgi:hypothetical protein
MGAIFSKVRKLGCEADRWPTFSVELKNERNNTSSPSYALVECIKVTIIEFAAFAIFVVILCHPVASHLSNYG